MTAERTRRSNGIVSRTRAYFGFNEPGLTWRQRMGVFHANERRAWARLLGSRRTGFVLNSNWSIVSPVCVPQIV